MPKSKHQIPGRVRSACHPFHQGVVGDLINVPPFSYSEALQMSFRKEVVPFRAAIPLPTRSKKVRYPLIREEHSRIKKTERCEIGKHGRTSAGRRRQLAGQRNRPKVGCQHGGASSVTRVLMVECSPGRSPVFLKDGNAERLFVRSGVTTLELTGNQAQEYIRQRFGR